MLLHNNKNSTLQSSVNVECWYFIDLLWRINDSKRFKYMYTRSTCGSTHYLFDYDCATTRARAVFAVIPCPSVLYANMNLRRRCDRRPDEIAEVTQRGLCGNFSHYYAASDNRRPCALGGGDGVLTIWTLLSGPTRIASLLINTTLFYDITLNKIINVM